MDESMLKISVILRMCIIAALTLLLLIPQMIVESLVSERVERRDAATKEVSQGWGGPQTLAGPILSIPYKIHVMHEDKTTTTELAYAHFLPSHISIQCTLHPEVRYRSIYEVALYQAQCSMTGEFASPDFNKLHIAADDIQWNDAVVTFGISDLKGIRDTIDFRWNEKPYPTEPGTAVDEVVNAGVTVKPHLEKKTVASTFSVALSLNGSSEIRFVPVGEVTDAVIDSKWGDPSYVGMFLPAVRKIQADQSHAEWKILNLNRNFPQEWTGGKYKILESSFGTSFFLPVDEYQKINRAIKYALLFIALTFAAFFLSELITKTTLHPVQYALVGLALVLFYVLLLSFSEHIRFNTAYVLTSFSVIGLVTLYAYWISIKKQIAIVIGLVLSALYGFLFVTLQLQDYALLLGSLGLFAVLFVIMYFTRSIDWFTINKQQKEL
jgi:inner membrane protein